MALSTGGPTCCHRPRPLYAEQGGEGYERLTDVDFNPLPMPGAVVRSDQVRGLSRAASGMVVETISYISISLLT
jgi:hypothetical protein